MQTLYYKVSILVPIYGAEKYIERCAVSLFEQTYDNIEYIFVNDCTKDRSMEVLDNVMKRYLHRQRQILIINHDHNRGLAAARNTAIDTATGDFVIHVDNDDWIEASTVEKCVKKQQETNADIVSFDWVTHWKSTNANNRRINVSTPYEMAKLTLYTDYNIWGRMIRRSLYIDHRLRCIEGANIAEDYSITSRLAYYAKKITILHEYLQHYNCMNTNSYSYKLPLNVLNQIKINYSVLMDFYNSKGVGYQEFYNIARIQFLVYVLRETHDNGEFKNAIKELKNFDKYYLKFINSNIRYIVLLSNNRSIVQHLLIYLRKFKYFIQKKGR